MKNKSQKNNLFLFYKKDIVDDKYPFLFVKDNFGIIFIIFLLTTLAIPFLFCLVITYGFNTTIDNNNKQQINMIFMIITSCVGFFCTFYLKPKYWDWIFVYLFSLLPVILLLIISILTSIMKIDSKGDLSSILSEWAQILAEAIIIFVFLLKFKNINKIVYTFKKTYLKLIIIVCISLLFIYFLSFFISSYLIESKLLKLDTSKNQESLEKLMNPDSSNLKVFSIITMVIATIIIAPLCEEICARHSVFFISNNRWAGLFVSMIYFGFIHYGPSGDFEHFLSYTTAGFVLSYLFNYVNGNITYSWLTHLLWNSISLTIFFWG